MPPLNLTLMSHKSNYIILKSAQRNFELKKRGYFSMDNHRKARFYRAAVVSRPIEEENQTLRLIGWVLFIASIGLISAMALI